MDQELDEHIAIILAAQSFAAADPLLLELGRLQETIATLAFKHRATLSDRLREFVRDFDRFDVPHVRQNTFQKIKRSEFPYQSGKANESEP